MKAVVNRSAAALGFFDGLHMGHKAVISAAVNASRRLGLPVSVLTFRGEPALPKFAGRKDVCLMTFEDKKELLQLCGAQYVVAYDFNRIRYMSPKRFFRKIILGDMNAAFVTCGEDFRFGRGGKGDAAMLAELCAKYGVEFEVVPQYKIDGVPVSSTHIRGLIRDGNVGEALKMLGHAFMYTLPVERGKQLGRTLGFPTINQRIPDFMVRPKYGVYAGFTTVGDTAYCSMTDIGVKPTVSEGREEIMETHIFGFEGDLYDRDIKVELTRFIRPEMKFNSVEELKKQLDNDKATVEALFGARMNIFPQHII